jgi:hypothetical protein
MPAIASTPTQSVDGASNRWLAQRSYHDLPEDVERLLRAAGLAWHDEPQAERLLAEAERRCPDHVATLIAQYRYRLYKHRFPEAAVYATALLKRAAEAARVGANFREVSRDDAPFHNADPALRFWMWALQAYGYVLLRCDRDTEGLQALRQLAWLDETDQTKTRALIQVIEAREANDPDDSAPA